MSFLLFYLCEWILLSGLLAKQWSDYWRITGNSTWPFCGSKLVRNFLGIMINIIKEIKTGFQTGVNVIQLFGCYLLIARNRHRFLPIEYNFVQLKTFLIIFIDFPQGFSSIIPDFRNKNYFAFNFNYGKSIELIHHWLIFPMVK